MFGGHGTSGWLSRYDVYFNDCIVLDRGECFTLDSLHIFFSNLLTCQLYCLLVSMLKLDSCVGILNLSGFYFYLNIHFCFIFFIISVCAVETSGN